MNERDERNELTGQLAMNGKGKLSTSRRGIMKAMALTTVGTAAASVYLPTASAAPPAAIDDTDTGGSVHKAATFPTTPGFSYRSYTGSDFHAETNSDDDIYDTNGAIHAAPGPNDPSVWVLYLDYPNGTVIREVVLFYIDNDAVKNIEGRLVRYDPTTQSATRVADFISSGAASTTIKASPLTINGAGPFPVTVDTTTFAYTVRVLLPVTANVQLLGVRVGFTNDGIFNSFQLLPAASGVGAPVAGAHLAGELYTDSAGSLFYCKASGSPGTWINLTAVIAPVPSLHFLPTPERFVDTRAGAGNIGGVTGPLAPNTTKTFQITGRNGSSGNPALQVPDAATAIVGTLTAIGTGASLPGSFLTIWPGGVQPTVSSVNYGPPPASVLATQFSTGLTLVGGHGNVNVFNRSDADYLIDVIGYYS